MWLRPDLDEFLLAAAVLSRTRGALNADNQGHDGPLLAQLPEPGPLLAQLPPAVAALAPHVEALLELGKQLLMPEQAAPLRLVRAHPVAPRPTSQDTRELRARLDRLLRNVEQTKVGGQKAQEKVAQMRAALDPDGWSELARVNAELDRRRERERLRAAQARRPATVKGTRPQQNVQVLHG